MRVIFVIMLAVALVFTSRPARPAEREFDYLSPLPGSIMVSRLTNIILRPSRNLDPRGYLSTSSLRVTGSRSGRVDVTARLSDDARTLTYRPAAPFIPGETVTVEILTTPVPGGEKPAPARSFSFTISASAPRGRPAAEVREGSFSGRRMLLVR